MENRIFIPHLPWLPNILFKITLSTIGVLALFANVSLAIAVLRGQLWRKSHVYIYYLLLLSADFVASVGYIATGVSSVVTIGDPAAHELSQLHCTFIGFAFYFGHLLYTFCMLSIAIDRLVSVRHPVFYRLHFDRLQLVMLSLSLIFSIVISLAEFSGVAPEKTVSVCDLGDGVARYSLRLIIVGIFWAGSLLVPLIYTASMVSLKCYQLKRTMSLRSSGGTDGETDAEERFARSAALLVGICLCTATIGLTGMFISMFLIKDEQLLLWLRHCFMLLIQLSALLNPIVLLWQHKNVKLSTRFCRRTLVSYRADGETKSKRNDNRSSVSVDSVQAHGLLE